MPAPAYRTVEKSIWDHSWFRALSPTAKLVALHLLTGQSTTAIPGLFSAGQAQLAEQAHLPLETWLEGFQEGVPEGFGPLFQQPSQEPPREPERKVRMKADWKARLVWLPTACRSSNRPMNPNQIKSWRGIVDEHLPKCPLLWEAIRGIEARVIAMVDDPEPFTQAFRATFPE